MSFVSGSNSAFSSQLLLFVLVLEVKTLLGCRFQLLAVELFELLHGILVNRVSHVEHLQALLPQCL